MIMFVIQYQSHRAETDLRRELVACLLAHGSTFSRVGASGKPGAVQLEVDSRSEGEFAEHDIAFLQGAANILGMAIERQRYERQLKIALDRHQVLLKEI